MELWLTGLFTFLVTPPGNLIYHLVLAFSIAAALFGAVNIWSSNRLLNTKRIIFGLSVLFLLQITLFIISAFPAQSTVNVLPPADRAVTLLSLIWIAWIWVFPERSRIADAATLVVSFCVFLLLVLTLVLWPPAGSSSIIDQTLINTIWQVFSLGFSLVTLAFLLFRKKSGWIIGLAIFLLASAGHFVTLLLADQGNFPGAVRLAQIAMFPMLLSLTQRFTIVNAIVPAPVEKVAAPGASTKNVRVEYKKEEKILPVDPSVQEKRRFATDPKTLHALLSLAAETQPEKIGNALVHGVAQAIFADLSFLVLPVGDDRLNITCGYDLIREENLGGASIAGNAVPALWSAIKRGKHLRLQAGADSADLVKLGQALGLGNAGNLLSIPLVSQSHDPIGALLLLSPYSNRTWSTEDQSFLTNVAALFVPILERGQKMTALQMERDAAQKQAALADEKLNGLSGKMKDQLDKDTLLEEQAAELAALKAAQHDSQTMIERMRSEAGSSKKKPPLHKSNVQVDQELHMALEELAYLQNSLAEANIKLVELDKKPEAPINNDQVEVIASLSQELRQPMSSIVGYTDLLLGESVGILGALQRKFIERIKASTERIGGLIDDLIQITTLEAVHVEIKPEAVDLNLIIDNAVAYTSTQIREKNITLQLETPETPPQIQTDREALQQIIIHLLQNAGAASPSEGTIGLHLHIQEQEEKDFLQIAVTDSGGGIAPDDIERVFQRRYRADHTLIQGVGDTSVGLSIAKSLVDAQHGRIWVDSKPGVGACFSVLLQVNRIQSLEEE